MKPNLHLLVMGLFLFVLNGLMAQNQSTSKPYIPPSPNASSFGNYFDQTTPTYSGVPSISVPIHTIKTNFFEMPINLTYDAKGIKAKDYGSWVGLNWNLNAGGVIARTKRDKNDFASNGFFKVHPLSRGSSSDVEPDMYFFSFGSYSGKFIIEYLPNGSPAYQVIPLLKNNLRFEITTAEDWKVTTPDGTQYLFQEKEFTTEHTYNPSMNETETYVSSWFLTKIILGNGQEVVFTYDVNKPDITRTINGVYRRFLALTYPSTIPSSCHMEWTSFRTSNPDIAVQTTTDVSTDEVVLSSINYPTGFIRFVTQQRTDLNDFFSRRLYQIVIHKGESINTEIFKTFTLEHDYYTTVNNDPGHENKRLRLIKLTESASLKSLPPYIFEYNSSNLPSKTAISNGGAGGYIQSNDGLISKIKYPTGGETNYIFEQHEYLDIVTKQQIYFGYGARIKEITQKQGSTVLHKKKFSYFNGKQLVLDFGGYTFPYVLTQFTCSSDPYYNPTIQVFFTEQNYLGGAVSLTEQVFGEAIGYDKVSILFGENGELGKTEYEFENVQYQQAGTNWGVPYETSKKNGTLKKLTSYRYDNGSYVKLKEDIYTYSLSSYFVTNGKRRYFGGLRSYDVTAEWLKLDEVSSNDYKPEDGSVINNTIEYEYSSSNTIQPVATTSKNSKGEVVKTVVRTPLEKTEINSFIPLSTTASSAIDLMLLRNIVNVPIQKISYRNNVATSVEMTNYKHWSPDVVKPENVEVKQGSGPIETKMLFKKYDSQGKLLEQQQVNNVSHAYIYSSGNDFPSAIAVNASNNEIFYDGFEELTGWDYTLNSYNTWNNRTGKVAGHIYMPLQSKRVSYSNTVLALNLATSKKFKYSGWAFSEGPVAEIAIYMRRATDPVGTFSLTDYVQFPVDLRKWVYAEKEVTVPADVVQIKMRIDNNGGGSVWFDDIRLHPSRAKMTTYTYEPLVGMTSETDENQLTTFYSYDAFGRLELVKNSDGDIVKKICYNMAGQQEDCSTSVFKSAAIANYFSRVDCGTGMVSSPTWAVVPYGQFTSAINQYDADAKATAYAQSVANQNSICYQPIYARVEYESAWVDEDQGTDYIFYAQVVNVFLRFYSDEACTVPYTLTQNIPINVNRTDYLWTSSETTFSGAPFSGVALSGTAELQLEAEMPLFGYWDVFDENGGLVFFERWASTYNFTVNVPPFVFKSSNYNGISLPVWF